MMCIIVPARSLGLPRLPQKYSKIVFFKDLGTGILVIESVMFKDLCLSGDSGY